MWKKECKWQKREGKGISIGVKYICVIKIKNYDNNRIMEIVIIIRWILE